ncbi:hypothetical protein LTR33_007815 [Friedmanniomyces endolithicus]|nr:hypothetical protein LTR33_007815 [Friedmanniomyces endolithicus]
MVALNIVEESNARIKDVPSELVAVFVGSTNGVGETTASSVYHRKVQGGRQPNTAFVFIQRDTGLMRNVDAVCNEIRKKEKVVNLLFLSVGTLEVDGKTEEGLHYASALTIYARNRFITNLLPLLQQAQSLRRVVSVYGATFEGQIRMDDFKAASLNPMAKQSHTASVTTLALEAHHRFALEVSFVLNFPGSVKSGIDRGSIGPLMRTLKTIFKSIGAAGGHSAGGSGRPTPLLVY